MSDLGKKILIIGHAVQYGGAEVYLLEIINELIKQQFQITVLWCNKNPPVEFKQKLESQKVTTIYDNFKVWSPDSYGYNFRFKKIITNEVYDYILFNRTGGWAKFSDLILTARLCCKAPMICVEHYHPPEFNIKHLNPLRTLKNLLFCRLQARCFDKIICMNKLAKKTFSTFLYGYDCNKLTVIYNGIDTNKFQLDKNLRTEIRREFLERNELVILFLGRMSEEKGPRDLLESWLRLSDTEKNSTQLWFVGEGSETAVIEQRLENEPYKSKVKMFGFRKNVIEFLSAADVLVMPSHQESFGISLAEAISMDRYCIATNVGGIPELAEGFENVTLVPPNSVNDIHRQISDFLKFGPPPFSSKSIRARLKDKFSIEKMCSETVSTILEH